jgi:hypothetical protein
MIYEVRTTTGTGMPATMNGVAYGATHANALLYLETNGKLKEVATNGVKVIGIGLNAGAAEDSPITFLPFLDGVEILIETENAVGQGNVGVPSGITVTSGDAVLNDNEAGYDILFISALDPNNTKKAWVKPVSGANQNLVGG